MARNGTGTYSLPESAFTSGTAISSTAVNSNFSDIASALTASLAKDGQTTPTANLPMGGYLHTGVGNATARTHYAAAGQVIDNALQWGGTAGGTADAMTLTMSPGITAYATGQRFAFVKNASANTGAATVNINSVGAKSIVRMDGSTAMVANELPASAMIEIIYDGTSFRLVSVSLPGIYATAAPVAASDGATITIDMAAGRVFTVTLGGNRTLGAPSNQVAGQSGIIIVSQDGTGSRTLSYSSDWDFPGGAPTLSTAASAKDVISYYVQASGTILCTINKAFS